MIKKRCGFTLIEVSLFLAVTGILFVGIVLGVQGSLFNQRYNDAVQNFAEFLRIVYSQTANVENTILQGGGRSGKAIYGKLVTFGEKYNLEGRNNEDNALFSYTVIGDADANIESGGVMESLAAVRANVISEQGEGYALSGIVEQYFPRWMMKIQTTKTSPYEDFKGALLIVRHPNSGTMFTYVMEGETIEINEMLKTATALPDPLNSATLAKFSIKDVDFCINPAPEKHSSIRRDVRIVEGARNASGVEVLRQDDYTAKGNRCK